MTDDIKEIPYTVNFEEYPNCLYALVHGEQYGYEVLAGFLREIADECVKRNLNRVIIEENISATASQEDVFRIASELPQLGYADLKLAYIDRFTEQQELNEYGRKIAADSGVNVQIFNSFDQAYQWVSEDS